MGIGRPSTYAPTLSTIIKREYVVKQDKKGMERDYKELTLKQNEIKEVKGKENYGAEKAKLFPTNTGMVVNDFLVELFPNVVDFSFTANVEKEFDEIAEGKLPWQQMIDGFYQGFHQKIGEVEGSKVFKKTEARELGLDPKSGKPIFAKIGKFGPYVQVGEATEDAKPQYANLKKGQLVETITLEEAIELFSLPREVGFFEDKPMVVGVGKYGPYVKYDDKFYSLDRVDDPYTVEAEVRIAAILKRGDLAGEGEGLGFLEEKPITTGMGKYGPFISTTRSIIHSLKVRASGNDTREAALKPFRNSGKWKARRSSEKLPKKPRSGITWSLRTIRSSWKT